MDPARHVEVPAYVLGLEHGFRGSQLVSELGDLGLSVRQVAAVDATALSSTQLEAIYDSAAARWIERELVPAEAACAFGHLTMMRAFLRTGCAWALFLEDDATLQHDPTLLLESLPSDLTSPMVVHLNADVTDDLAGPCLLSAGPYDVRAVDVAPDRTVGYLANRALALLATTAYENHRVDSVADWPIRWRHEATFAVCEPPIVGHSGEDSAIESDRVVAQAAGVRGKRAQFARLVGTILGPSLVVARRHGYRLGLVYMLNVEVPVSRVARRHLNAVRLDRPTS